MAQFDFKHGGGTDKPSAANIPFRFEQANSQAVWPAQPSKSLSTKPTSLTAAATTTAGKKTIKATRYYGEAGPSSQWLQTPQTGDTNWQLTAICLSRLPFSKYHANGNDFILLDNRQNILDGFLAIRSFVRKMCDRQTGVGADGVVALSTEKAWPPTAMTSLRRPAFQFPTYQMTYYNSDGAEGTFCGNGARCLVAYACRRLGIVKQTKCLNFFAKDGQHSGSYFTPSIVKVRVGDVERVEILSPTDYFIDTGSPHYVTYVDQLDTHDVIKEGRRIRWSQAYERYGGCNANFVQRRRVGDDVIMCRTYERVVEDETQSCDSGAVAVALADYVNSRRHLSSSRQDKENDDVRRVNDLSVKASDVIRSIRNGIVHKRIRTKGGEVEVTFEVTYEGDFSGVRKFVNIDLIGPATHVYSGKYVLQ